MLFASSILALGTSSKRKESYVLTHAWRKSSRSGNNGQCVEVRKSMLSPDWHKSTRSSGNGNCVEVRHRQNIQIRDSKDPNGPMLTVTDNDWLAFLNFVK